MVGRPMVGVRTDKSPVSHRVVRAVVVGACVRCRVMSPDFLHRRRRMCHLLQRVRRHLLRRISHRRRRIGYRRRLGHRRRLCNRCSSVTIERRGRSVVGR